MRMGWRFGLRLGKRSRVKPVPASVPTPAPVPPPMPAPEPFRTKNRVNLENTLLVFGYSPRHLAYVDPRIEAHLKDHFIPSEENIFGYVRADIITKDYPKSNLRFPGFVIFTLENMYILKILNEDLGDLDKWLEAYEHVSLANVESIRAICFNQGVLIKCKDVSDESTSDSHVSYLVLLLEEKRTRNFLTFMKNSTIFIPEKIHSDLNAKVPVLPQLGENIQYFLMSEAIVIYRNQAEWRKYNLSGFAFSRITLLILQFSEADEPSKRYETDMIIEYERKFANLTHADDRKASLLLQFEDKDNSITELWYIKTGIGMTYSVFDIFTDFWRPPHI